MIQSVVVTIQLWFMQLRIVEYKTHVSIVLIHNICMYVNDIYCKCIFINILIANCILDQRVFFSI